MVVVIKKGDSKKLIQRKLKKLKSGKGFPASKFTGKVNIEEDAVLIQRRLRDEWK